MKIRRIPLSKAFVLKLQPEERSFLMLAGHMLNELNSLNKIFAWCLHSESPIKLSEIEALANGVQAQIYARLLAGKLNEARTALNTSFFKTKLAQRLDDKLQIRAKEELKNIKTYFNKPNAIFKVRNDFAFHYSVEAFDAHCLHASDEPAFEFILGGTVGNNLALASEFVVNAALLSGIDSADRAAALQRFLDDVKSLTASFIVFLEGAIVAIIEDVSGLSLAGQGFDEEISPGQGFNDVMIPYFYEHGLGNAW